jgi:hypothetical protein
MRQITAEARRRGKACGLFETGAIGSARPDYYDWLYKALTADGVGFAFVNLWGGYEIPRTSEGKECLKCFLARPKVLTFRDGIDLTKPLHDYPPNGGRVADVTRIQAGTRPNYPAGGR